MGSWRVVDRCGRGAYGTVYRAVGVEGPMHPVALKLAMHPRDERFAREVELLSRIRHPNVPRLVGHGVWQHPSGALHPYVVMAYVDGMPLYQWGRECLPTSRRVLQLLASLARALEATHAAGGLHRDVKGDNVRVSDGDGQPFLLDFGSGHYLGAATLTWQPFPPGTPAYRSPEAWRTVIRPARPLAAPYAPGPADDVFALGITAYRLVTDTYPLGRDGSEEGALFLNAERSGPRPPCAVNARCCSELSALIRRMLSVDPEARGSARELAESLEQAARKSGPAADVPLFVRQGPLPGAEVTLFVRQGPLPAGAGGMRFILVEPRREAEVTRFVREEPPSDSDVPWLSREAPGPDAEVTRFGREEPGPDAEMPRSIREEPRPEGVSGFRQPLVQQEPALRSRSWLVAASLGAMLSLGTAWMLRSASVEGPATVQLAEQDEAKDGGTAAVGDSALMAPVSPAQVPSAWSTIALELPPKPFPGQRRPDANGRCPGKVQVPIHGGCWIKIAADAKDCDKDVYVFKGACYLPVFPTERPATSSPAACPESR
ncbi:serine/threonine protein kinase [Pyxidicoccus sp. 3LFB2]